MQFGDWNVTENSIEWSGKGLQRFVIPANESHSTRPAKTYTTVFDKWILLTTDEEWLTQNDLYDLNYAYIFAAGKLGLDYNYDIFDATPAYQYELLKQNTWNRKNELQNLNDPLVDYFKQKYHLQKSVRKVEIPKPQSGTRMLGIPTVSDRLIQQGIAQRLSPRYEEEFSNYSYGFREGRNGHQAVLQAQTNLTKERMCERFELKCSYLLN